MPTVTTIDLSRNQITVVDENATAGMPLLLTDLNFERNAISIVAPNAMAGLTHLEVLILRHNRLQRITAGMFSDHPVLRSIDLQDNPQLLNVDSGAMVNLPRLEVLKLTRSPIEVVGVGSFTGLGPSLSIEWDSYGLTGCPSTTVNTTTENGTLGRCTGCHCDTEADDCKLFKAKDDEVGCFGLTFDTEPPYEHIAVDPPNSGAGYIPWTTQRAIGAMYHWRHRHLHSSLASLQFQYLYRDERSA